MRKLILQMNITADGFVAGPAGELDWMTTSVVDQQLQMLSELTNSMDTIIMGSGMAGGFIKHWEDVVNNKRGSAEYPYAKIFVDTPKIIFSKSVSKLEGKNIHIENGDIVKVIGLLKKQPGKDMIVYGGAGFVSSLLEYKLIDDLYLFVNPVAIGKGLTIFNHKMDLRLISSTSFSNGIIANRYQQSHSHHQE